MLNLVNGTITHSPICCNHTGAQLHNLKGNSMIWLSFYPSSSAYIYDSFMFVYGEDVESAQPFRMIGAPMRFLSLRDAVEAAHICGFCVCEDGRVISLAA